MTDKGTWRGIAIQESFEGPGLPPRTSLVRTRSRPLGGEEDQGPVHLQAIVVRDEDLEEVTDWASQNLRPGWYMHLVKGDKMRVVFHGHVFDLTKGNHERIEHVRRFGIETGIHPKQLHFEKLFDHPFA